MVRRRTRRVGPGGRDCAFASPEEELLAIDRAKKWEFEDPFEEVEPALLSAVEIRNYARVTGMLHPYDDEKLKAASYPAGMAGLFVRWAEGKKIEERVSGLTEIVLPPNSISFIQTDVTFRLPHYIAMRFNLQISHVHRGILLGTGPVVDPGFQGRLLIPLHNLTSTDYKIPVDEALIWVEFTKTTFKRPVKEVGYDPSGWERFLFAQDKRFMTPDQYFRRANALYPIESSIPDAIKDMTDRAERAASDALAAKADAVSAKTAAVTSKELSDAADRKLLGIGFAGFAAAVIGVLAIYMQAVGIVQDAVSSVRDAEKIVAEAKAFSEADKGAADRIRRLEERIKELEPNRGSPSGRPSNLPSPGRP